MSVRFAGLILAGGAGERWGGPKAWALLPDGQSFLASCAELLQAGGASVVAATLPPGSAGDSVRHLQCLELPETGMDMFSSFCWGLRGLASEGPWDAVVVLPVDHPLVAPETVAALVAAGPPAAIPTVSGRHGHPVCLWREVTDRVSSGTFSGPTLREVLRAAGARDVPVADPGVRANCNTPEQLRAALHTLGV